MLRTAIIGCGRIAGGYDRALPVSWSATHAGAYHLCPDTELVAVADPSPHTLAAFQEKWGVKSSYLDYREMLAKESIDILSLCLPTEYHFKAFQETDKYAIPAIFCEKPLAYDLEEARAIYDLGQERIVTVNYFRRWNPTIINLVNEIKLGCYGKCLNIVVRYPKGIFVNGSHFIDMMRWIFGEPETVRFLSIAQPDSIDPGIDFVMNFKNGPDVFFINLPGIDYVFAEVDILAQTARLVLAQRGQSLRIEKRKKEQHYQLFDIIEKEIEVETDWKNCLTRAVEEIAHATRHGGGTSCTLTDGLRVDEICFELHRIARQNG